MIQEWCVPIEFNVWHFFRLEDICNQSEVKGLSELAKYIKDTWIFGKLWTPSDWVQFREHNRTNNYAESYHSGLHKRVRQGNNPLFVLLRKLYAEAEGIAMSLTQFINYIPKKRKQRDVLFEEYLILLWNKLANRQISPVVFLQVITKSKFIKENHNYVVNLSRGDLFDEDEI